MKAIDKYTPEQFQETVAQITKFSLWKATAFRETNSPHEGYGQIVANFDLWWHDYLVSSGHPIKRMYSMIGAAMRYITDLTPFGSQLPLEERLQVVAEAMVGEVQRAMVKHAPMVSIEEAYGVLKEEIDELFEEVRPDKGRSVAAQKEALQIGAMGYRLLMDTAEAH